MRGELVEHYDNDTYRYHVPVEVSLDKMSAVWLDDPDGRYWEPSESVVNVLDDSWEAIEVGGETYPAVYDWDLDGIEQMEETYGEGGFIVVDEED